MPDAEVLIDYEIGLAYCRPYYSEHDVTKEVLRYLHDEGFLIDIRLACWQRLNSAILAELSLLNYLLDEASRLLADHDPEAALAEYQSTVLTESNLYNGGPPGVSFNEELAPDVDDLRSEMEEMGLEDFRFYAHDLLEVCPDAQSQLDIMIRDRYESTAEDPYYFTANVEGVVDSQREIDALTDAYRWSTHAGNIFIASEASLIYTRRSEILRGVVDDKLKIVCPTQIQARIS